jgi:hypothetical protein
MSKVYITGFMNCLTQFLCELQNVFPNDTKIKSYCNLVEMLPSIMYKKTIEQFYMLTKPYEEQIVNSDEEFMLNNNFDGYNDTVMDNVFYFKRLWKDTNLTDSNKKVIFEYINVLFKLSKKINE